MRMWMIWPAALCRQHLLGEHRELHAIAESLCRAYAGSARHAAMLCGHLALGQLEHGRLRSRHEALVAEMAARGYTHASPLGPVPRDTRGRVDREISRRTLAERCGECAERILPIHR